MTWSETNQSFFEGESECYAIAWPKSDWVTISLAEDQIEGKLPQEQAGPEDICSRGLAEHHHGWNPTSADIFVFLTPVL